MFDVKFYMLKAIRQATDRLILIIDSTETFFGLQICICEYITLMLVVKVKPLLNGNLAKISEI